MLGGLVTGIQNETTGKDNVPLTVHPYMPARLASSSSPSPCRSPIRGSATR